jgi:hypothetical protein
MHTAEYAHIFLFRCPACLGALTSVCFNSESNLETADDNVFRPKCDCGWSGALSGFLAVRHWVQPWESASTKQTPETSSRAA